MSRILKMVKGNKGQGMVEYALIIALVAIALIAGITTLSGDIGETFSAISGSLSQQ